MKLVVDASVALKWFFGDLPNEQDAVKARQLIPAIENGAIALLQPVHWMAEVLAVVTRQRPELVGETLAALEQTRASIETDDAIYMRAAELSNRLNQHLFDTLYHAVALERQATLVTADERYFEKARIVGAIVRLADFALSEGGE